MDKMNYPQLVQQALDYHHQHSQTSSDLETHAIYDQQRDRYQLLRFGWQGSDRTFACVAYVTIENGKIWIHRDFTEPGIAHQLLEQGIPKTDIVLAFHAPSLRPYTEFAIG
jgi:hypothetical protein